MSDEVSVEATGETVGEAKWKALRELERRAHGFVRDSVRFQVVSEGQRGLLGVGYSPARVVATAAAGDDELEPTADDSPVAARVREIVERVVRAIGAGARVDVVELPDEIVVTCTGGDAGLLIGKHGQTIDSLQYVVNAILWRREDAKPVTVDAAGYRDRRRVTLERVAVRAAERAAVGVRVTLDPMTAVERKVVHERLKEYPGVRTASEGAEPNRRVIVEPDAEAAGDG